MTTFRLLPAATVAIGLVAAPVVAQEYDQLAAQAGLTQQQAAGLSVDEIAARFFNNTSDGNNQQSVNPRPPAQLQDGSAEQLASAAGLEPDVARAMTLDQIAAHFNTATMDNIDQTAALGIRSRQAPGLSAGALQLARSAGTREAEARSMSLDEIYIRFHNRASNVADRFPALAEASVALPTVGLAALISPGIRSSGAGLAYYRSVDHSVDLFGRCFSPTIRFLGIVGTGGAAPCAATSPRFSSAATAPTTALSSSRPSTCGRSSSAPDPPERRR
jgi:hypothetical protein